MIAVVIVFVITCGVMYGISTGSDNSGKRPTDAVAKVNGKKVSRIDVETTASRIAEEAVQRMPGIRPTEGDVYLFRRQAVDSMGLEMLLKKEIKNRGIKVGRKELNERIDAIIAQFPTKEEFENYLSRIDKSKSDFKDDVKFQMAQQLLVDKITSEIKVSEEDMKKFYEDGKNSIFVQPSGYEMLMAVFDNKAAAEMAKKAIEGGAKWDGITKEQKAVNATEEAKPEFVPDTQFAQEPFASIKALEIGKVSEVKQMPETERYFIFLKKSHKDEKHISYDEAKNDIVKMIQNQRGRMEISKLVRKLKKNIEVEIIDKSFFVPEEKKAEQPEQAAEAK